MNFDSLPHRSSSADIPELPSFRRSRLEKETVVATLSTSAKESRISFSGGQDNEDDVPLVCPTTLESRVQSKSAHDMTVPINQPAPVKRSRTRNQMTPIQIENHENSVHVRRQDAGEAATAPVIPSVELRRMSFIVTNVSRWGFFMLCPLLAAAASPSSSCIIMFRFDQFLTQRKYCRHQQRPTRSNGHVQKSSCCSRNYAWYDCVDIRSEPRHPRSSTAPLTLFYTVANVTSSAVLASSCPLPPHLVVMCETVVSASTQMLVALALGITPLHCSWLGSCSCADANVAVISESFVLPLDAIIPKEYSRFANSRGRPVCVTPLPIELRVLSGRRLGYHARGASAARYPQLLLCCSC